MIRKLRLKFVAVCMLLVTAVLMVVFASVYTSARHNILENSRSLLQRVITEDASMRWISTGRKLRLTIWIPCWRWSTSPCRTPISSMW